MPSDETRPPILFFGNDWFAENRTSSHQIARQLAKQFRVFYIECPGWRAPRGSGRDLKKVFVKLWRFLRGTRTTDEGLRLRTLFQIPFHRFAAVRWLNRRLIGATLAWMKWRHGIKDPITWFHVPHVPFLVGDSASGSRSITASTTTRRIQGSIRRPSGRWTTRRASARTWCSSRPTHCWRTNWN